MGLKVTWRDSFTGKEQEQPSQKWYFNMVLNGIKEEPQEIRGEAVVSVSARGQSSFGVFEEEPGTEWLHRVSEGKREEMREGGLCKALQAIVRRLLFSLVANGNI